MTMNELWRNDRSLLAEPTSPELRDRAPAGPLGAAEDHEGNYLSPEEIHAWAPYKSLPEPSQRREALRGRLLDIGCWTPAQIAGRRWSIGCVSLEITQRCNLDCTLCYLSEHSEAVRDVPLEELFRRIEIIYAHYGENTDVQVSGGDPTLRAKEDLIQIVHRITAKGMRASLFTNGILASRTLLSDLCRAGLVDVAFHVDLTQQRKGYRSEADLNALRQKYIERARGLPLSVMFNTTVFAGNFHQLPALVRFFRSNADMVRLISFQLQADTGRGVLRQRDVLITQDSVIEQIHQGSGTSLCFDTLAVGHPRCNKYAMAFEINGQLYDFLDDPGFIVPLLNQTAEVQFDRRNRRAAVLSALRAFAKAKGLWWRGAKWLARTLWLARQDLWASRGRINKLSFVVHNFMDGCKLERERLEGCVFMVATADGPMSMCMHNAKRDDYVLRPVKLNTPAGLKIWDPLGGISAAGDIREVPPTERAVQTYPLKYLKGRSRAAVLERKGAARHDEP